jgi:hypothetical protein
MGYRSDVTMIMYPSADHRDKFAALKLYVDENLPDEFEVVGEGDRRYLHCYIDGVKWYDSYEEVRHVQQSCLASGTICLLTPDDPSAKKGWHADTIFHYEFLRDR